MPQLIDLVVDGGILFNVSIRGRNVSLRLIIIVIRYKIFYGILWEKFLHFPVKLRRQRLIVGNDERWLVQCLNDIRHGKGLTGARHTQQCLELIALPKPFYKLSNSLRLVAGGLILGM